MSRPQTLETLAFAYELHVEGYTWDFIAEIVGSHNVEWLATSVRKLVRDGIESRRSSHNRKEFNYGQTRTHS